MPQILYLIDGHALAYRTYFALTSGTGTGFTTRSGEPTAGVYGFTSVLLKLLEQERPDYLAVAFDVGRTFRDEMFADYKGTREKMPDDLRTQMERIRQLVDAFNIPRLEREGYEADDVLGSAARVAVGQGLGVKIITGDRDLLQLVDKRVIVSLPGKSLSDSRDFLPEDVKQTLGVRPDQVVDYKALVGDKSDNIPGVAGIGEKTASALLETYGTLENIYDHLDELSAGVRKKLEAGKDNAELSRKLAKIVTDLDISIDLEQAKPHAFNPETIEGLFRELEFRSLMTRLEALEKTYGLSRRGEAQQLSLFAPQKKGSALTENHEKTKQPVELPQASTFSIVDTQQKLANLVDLLNKAKMISVDTETTSIDQMRAELVGISLAVEPGHGYYIPIGHQGSSTPQLDSQLVLYALRKPLTNPAIPKVGHNLKYDFVILARNGIRVQPLTFDTMIAEFLCNPESRNLGLKNLAWVRKDIRMTPIDELLGKGKKQITMDQVPLEQAAAYAAEDAQVVLRLIPDLKQELDSKQASSLMTELEMPLVHILAEMEMEGVALDSSFLRNMSGELSERLAEIETQVSQEVGYSFNLNSPQQLSKALFDDLKIDPPDRTQKTASGFYSTAADVLETLKGNHVVIDMILEYRELSKLRSTYLDALPGQVNPSTGRVHTSYNQVGAVTGRIASSDPNLQNIPIRTEQGRKVRNAFVADPGKRFLSVDYSQIELRIVAHMSKDQAMLEAFRAGQDIHATTAAAIYGIPLETVNKDQRRRAKGVNFGLIYGISAYGLTRNTDLTLAEAENFMQAYFEKFPGVKQYLDSIKVLAAQQGYVETLLGRRRYFPDLSEQSNRNLRMREEREAINAPIQGTAADIMKLAMLKVHQALEKANLPAKMILQVHDELVLECPQDELEMTARVVKQAMEGAYSLDVPMLTEARWGVNWGEMTVL